VPGSNPVQVNLEVSLTPIHRVTHQGTIGYGTDTEFRTQYRFQRHQRSERGDNLAAGFAWQSRNQELALSAEYRLPRTTRTPQYWVLSPTYRDRDQTFEVDIEGRNDKFPLAEGRVSDFYLRSGRVKFLNREMTPEPIIQTLFVDYLYERNTISNILVTPSPGSDIPESVTGSNISHHLSLGVEWDWPNFQGQGFDITGHRERLWLFTANEAWGSDLDFTQLYGSSRWVIPMGDDWRLVARGELGYTDAPVQELELEDNGDILRVSLTELPFRYRFSAGGSQSVRGYDFEELSNNGIGSNHILTGSVEVERRIWNNWSAAVFVDVGNAFNDWDDMRLRKGLGFGVRWYTAGFPLRLDLAQAQDLDGKPWRLHLTIGSPLF
jgi:translocation and assembly module TamA